MLGLIRSFCCSCGYEGNLSWHRPLISSQGIALPQRAQPILIPIPGSCVSMLGVRSAEVSPGDTGLLILGCRDPNLLPDCHEDGCVLLLFALTVGGFVLKCLIFYW